MRLHLVRHPDSPPDAVALAVEADITRAGGARLACRYRLSGPTDAIVIAPPATPQRADDLWRSTCFELFLQTAGGGYLEFNFAPSRRWAGYRFDGYRTGMTPIDLCEAPHVEPRLTPTEFVLDCRLDLGGLGEPVESGPWRAAVTAVVEEGSGLKTYWSVEHGPGKPDFHHPDSFVVEIPVEGHA
jgi:hypothetical protein